MAGGHKGTVQEHGSHSHAKVHSHCTDTLMEELKKLQMEYELRSVHLSENKGEIDWVKELCPWSEVLRENACKPFQTCSATA